MFGLPVWAVQLIIAVLKASGLINYASALSLRLIVNLDAKLQQVKTYHDNSSFPNPYPGQTNISNLEVTQPPN